MARPFLLPPILAGWTLACTVIGAWSLRRAPALCLGLLGTLFGAVAGFLVGNTDGPAEVPAYTVVGASLGLIANGFTGLLVTRAPPPSRTLGRAAAVALAVGPLAAGTQTLLLGLACPLYVTGRRAGYCDYQGVDVLGGWLSGVFVALLFDAAFVVGLLLASAHQARRLEDAEIARELGW